MSIEVRLVLHNLERLGKEGAQAVRRGMNKSAILIESEAKRLCPVDTGRLKSSITHMWRGGDEVVVGTNVKYASYVEFGTRPHMIFPREKKALYWDGAEHPVKHVYHPGTKPQPFLRPAYEKYRKMIPKLIKEELRALHR